MIVLGIDPGITGAIAWFVDGTIHHVESLPMIQVKVGKTMRSRLNAACLADTIRHYQQAGVDMHVYLEEVASRPGEGAVGAFSFGRGFGQIEGVLAGTGIPYTLVRPQTWKKALGVPADKGGARLQACQRYPSHAGSFARVKDDGRAEAALIAQYGCNNLGGAPNAHG